MVLKSKRGKWKNGLLIFKKISVKITTHNNRMETTQKSFQSERIPYLKLIKNIVVRKIR